MSFSKCWSKLPVVAGMLCLAGCVTSHKAAVDVQAAAAPLPAVETLRSGDHVRVAVFGEDRLAGDYEVDAAGFVSMPLAGTVKASGLSEGQLQDDITGRLRAAYLRDPKVTVDLLSKRPFYILGEVEKPGEYPYRSGLDIWRAMALASGQTYRASTSTVSIQRAGDPEFRDFKLAGNVPIGPGDVVRVPERWF